MFRSETDREIEWEERGWEGSSDYHIEEEETHRGDEETPEGIDATLLAYLRDMARYPLLTPRDWKGVGSLSRAGQQIEKKTLRKLKRARMESSL